MTSHPSKSYPSSRLIWILLPKTDSLKSPMPWSHKSTRWSKITSTSAQGLWETSSNQMKKSSSKDTWKTMMKSPEWPPSWDKKTTFSLCWTMPSNSERLSAPQSLPDKPMVKSSTVETWTSVSPMPWETLHTSLNSTRTENTSSKLLCSVVTSVLPVDTNQESTH